MTENSPEVLVARLIERYEAAVARLEPGAHDIRSTLVTASAAISAKRQADALERIATALETALLLLGAASSEPQTPAVTA